LSAEATRIRAAGFFARRDGNFIGQKKLHVRTYRPSHLYLKSKLNTELANNSDSPAAQSIHRLVSDAESISDEHFTQLVPSLPHAPKLMLAAQALNDAIAAGTASPASFYFRYWPQHYSLKAPLPAVRFVRRVSHY
jgi:hypothetical protein